MTTREYMRISGRNKQAFMLHDFLTAVISVIMIIWGMIPSSLVKVTDVSVEPAVYLWGDIY